MRTSALFFTAILLAAGFSGCTSDGYLGAIDENDQAAQKAAREERLWRRAADAHPATLMLAGGEIALVGASIEPFSTVSLRMGDSPFPPHVAPRPASRLFAVADVRVDGERGSVVFHASESSLVATRGAFEQQGAPVAATSSGVLLRLATAPALMIDPSMPCLDGPGGSPCPAESEEPLAPPELGDDAAWSAVQGMALAPRLRVLAQNLTFYNETGVARAPVAEIELDASRARLYARAGGVGFPLVPLEAVFGSSTSITWAGNLSVSARAPSGSLRLADETRALDGHRAFEGRFAGAGSATLSGGAKPSLSSIAGDARRIRVDDVDRLEARLRLAPDVVELSGPAGNVTRLRLILAETSEGADAWLTGYRINESVRPRFVGYEPFEMTQELLEVLAESRDPITPAALGIMIPFVVFVEALVAIVTAIFPPSLAGMLGAGEGRLLTFDLTMPATPQDVVILIEAANADPVRATVRMVPT